MKLTRLISLYMVLIFMFSFTSIMVKAEVVSKKTWNGYIYTGFMPKDDVDGDKSNYKITILNYKGSKTEITIPSKIEETKVTHVLSLSKAEKLTTLNIPEGIEYIRIASAPSLKTVTVDKNNKKYAVKNNILVNKKGTVLFSCPGGVNNPKIPSSVTKINHQAFMNFKQKKITLGKNVEVIDTYAFYKCTKLTTINFNKKLKTISSSAFEGCKSLKVVKLPKSVKKIGKFAFSKCTKLNKVFIYNKKCKINSIPKKATIYGYKNSTAEKFAKKNGNTFKAI